MDSDFPMKKSQLEEYISKWESSRDSDTVNQLLSETMNLLTYCLNVLTSAQEVNDCVENIGSPCAIDGQMIIPIRQVNDDGRKRICRILQDVKMSITANYVRMRRDEDEGYSPFNDPLLRSK